MKIIGEKINGTRTRVAQALAERDAAYVRDLAVRQAQAGADWLDVNAGTQPNREAQDLVWLVESVQAAVETPLCLDSANPQAIAAALQVVQRTPLINSISGEPSRLESILPLAAERRCPVIALAMDDQGIPKTAQDRLGVVRRVLAETRRCGLPDGDVYVDPLAMTISTDVQSGRVTLDTLRALRAEFPQAHLTLGLSNISFGLPARSCVNRAFVTLALEAGLDREMRAAVLAAEVVLGRDAYCLNYTRAYRKGVFEKRQG